MCCLTSSTFRFAIAAHSQHFITWYHLPAPHLQNLHTNTFFFFYECTFIMSLELQTVPSFKKSVGILGRLPTILRKPQWDFPHNMGSPTYNVGMSRTPRNSAGASHSSLCWGGTSHKFACITVGLPTSQL